MIEETLAADEQRTVVAQEFLEALRRRDTAEREDAPPFQKRQLLARAGRTVRNAETPEILRPVRALDDVGRGIMGRDEILQLAIALAVGLGEENVARALQVLDGLAEDAARQQVAVAEGIGLVHEQQVEAALERQVLEAVVEHERVAAKLLDRKLAGLHAVLVDEHDHAGEIFREHVGLVAGLLAVEQHVRAVAHNARRRLVGVREAIPEFFPKRLGLALVAAAEDGDAPAAVAQRPRKFLDHWRLARAAHSQVADNDNEATQRLIVKDALPVKPEPRLRDPAEQPGQRLQERPVNGRPRARAPPVDEIDRVEFEGVDLLLQPGLRH